MRAVVPRLHLIGPLGRVVDPQQFVEIALEASVGGVNAIHVRMPAAPASAVLNVARSLVDRLDQGIVMVNDRVDVALLASTGGVHLGEHSIPVRDARVLAGESMLIGRSVHDLAGAIAAEREGADYLVAGHVFDTQSKEGQAGRGLDWLEVICGSVQIPVIAIGGIDVGNAADVLKHGAHGLAVGRGILEASNPTQAAQDLALVLQ